MLEHIKGRIDTVKQFVLMSETGCRRPRWSSPASTRTCWPPPSPWPSSPTSTRTPGPRPSTRRARPVCPRASTSAIASSCCTPSPRWPPSPRPLRGGFHRDDVYMPLTPMFHVHAWGIPYVATMLGVKQVYPGKYVPEILLKLIAEREGHLLALRPDHPEHARERPAAAARRPFALEGAHRRLRPAPAGGPRSARSGASTSPVGYGLSESCPVLTMRQPDPEELSCPPRNRRTCAPHGHAVALVDLKVVDERGEGSARATTRRSARSSCAPRG